MVTPSRPSPERPDQLFGSVSCCSFGHADAKVEEKIVDTFCVVVRAVTLNPLMIKSS